MSYAELFLQSLFYPVLDFLKFIPRTHLDNHTGVERGIMLTHLPKMYGVKSITPSKSDTAPMTESVPISTCSGSMIPDTNVGGKIATINEVSDDQKATFFFS